MSDDTDDTDDTDAGRVLYLDFSREQPDKDGDAADLLDPGDRLDVAYHRPFDHDFSGELLGQRYKLEERIGVGQVSTLYRAKDRRLGIAVAVKVLHPEHNLNADLMRRFTQEARLASQVRHPNLVPALDFCGLGARRFIVFELVKGRTVQDLIVEETLSWRRATALICDLLAGLAAMHEAGVVHRDISPLNCLVDLAHGERGRLIDLGYARLVDKRADLDIAVPLQSKSTVIYGTEGYIDPERLHGGPADEKSDIFSIGAVWYAMLVGRPPLDPSSLDVAFTPIVLPLPMPEPLVAVLRGALAPRKERHHSVASVLNAIQHALQLVDADEKQTPVRVGWWKRRAGVFGSAVAGGAITAAALLSAQVLRGDEPARVATHDVERVRPPLTPGATLAAPALAARAEALPQLAPVPAAPSLPAEEAVAPAATAAWRDATVLANSSPSSKRAPGGPSSALRRALSACKRVPDARLDVVVAPGDTATINGGPPRGELGRCVEAALAKYPPKRRETFKL